MQENVYFFITNTVLRNFLFKKNPLPTISLCIHFLLLLLLFRFSHVRLCATPQTTAHQAAPSLEFSRQEHWSGLPFPSPNDGLTLTLHQALFKASMYQFT